MSKPHFSFDLPTPHARLHAILRRRLVRRTGQQPFTGASACLVFASSDNEQRQKVLATLTEHLPYNLHQVKADTLVGERHIETQGNLRETFDDTGEEGHILVFENADALYELPGAEEEKEAEEERTRRP